jgi:hypothetical protein
MTMAMTMQNALDAHRWQQQQGQEEDSIETASIRKKPGRSANSYTRQSKQHDRVQRATRRTNGVMNKVAELGIMTGTDSFTVTMQENGTCKLYATPGKMRKVALQSVEFLALLLSCRADPSRAPVLDDGYLDEARDPDSYALPERIGGQEVRRLERVPLLETAPKGISDIGGGGERPVFDHYLKFQISHAVQSAAATPSSSMTPLLAGSPVEFTAAMRNEEDDDASSDGLAAQLERDLKRAAARRTKEARRSTGSLRASASVPPPPAPDADPLVLSVLAAWRESPPASAERVTRHALVVDGLDLFAVLVEFSILPCRHQELFPEASQSVIY